MNKEELENMLADYGVQYTSVLADKILEMINNDLKALSNRCFAHTKGVLCAWCAIDNCTKRVTKRLYYKENDNNE